MVQIDVPVPCTNAEVTQECTSQNTDVARCSMEKGSVVKLVWEMLHSEPTSVKSQSTLAHWHFERLPVKEPVCPAQTHLTTKPF